MTYLFNEPYFRRFMQNEGTIVSGIWAWQTNASATNYASFRGQGAGYWNNSTAANNDEYKWANLYLGPGLYEIDIIYAKGPDHGIAQFLFGTTSLGTIDEYVNIANYNNSATITFTITTATTADLRFKVNGKNGSSTSYSIDFQRFELLKIG